MTDLERKEDERCADCGEPITDNSHMVYDAALREDVPICNACYESRREKYERECAQNDWAIPHG